MAALGIQAHSCLVGFPGAFHQKVVLAVPILHKGFEGPGAEFFGFAEVVDAGGFVRHGGLLKEFAGFGACIVEQDSLVAVFQPLVDGVLDGIVAGQPEGGAEGALAAALEQFVGNVVVEGVEPFMGDAAGAGVLGQGEAAGGGGVMGGYAGLAADAVLQGQGAAQGDEAFGAAEDGHQVAQGVVEQGRAALFFRFGDPAADLDGAELEPPPDVQEGYGGAAAVVRPSAVELSWHDGSLNRVFQTVYLLRRTPNTAHNTSVTWLMRSVLSCCSL